MRYSFFLSKNIDVMKNTINLILIDDHEMVLQGLKALLDGQPEIKIVQSFTNGQDAINQIKSLDIDIVLSDVNMPVINGFETAKRLRELKEDLKIILLSMENKEGYIEKAKAENLSGYVTKDAPIEELVFAIKKVSQGEVYFKR